MVADGVPTVKVFMNFPEFYPGDGATAELFAELGPRRRHGGRPRRERRRDRVAHAAADRRRLLRLALHRGQPARLGRGGGGLARDHARRERRLPDVRAARHVRGGGARDRRWPSRADCRCSPRRATTTSSSPRTTSCERPDGANWGNYPPPRPPWNRDALWEALAGRDARVTSRSDDYTCPLAIRNINGLDLPTVPSGHNGLETRLSVLYTESVRRRGMVARAIRRARRWRASRVALGLWPRKGSLLPGADADLVLFDPARSGVFSVDSLHTVEYSIWDGYRYEGAPSATILRGATMVDDGEWVGHDGTGRFLVPAGGPSAALRPARGGGAQSAALAARGLSDYEHFLKGRIRGFAYFRGLERPICPVNAGRLTRAVCVESLFCIRERVDTRQARGLNSAN